MSFSLFSTDHPSTGGPFFLLLFATRQIAQFGQFELNQLIPEFHPGVPLRIRFTIFFPGFLNMAFSTECLKVRGIPERTAPGNAFDMVHFQSRSAAAFFTAETVPVLYLPA